MKTRLPFVIGALLAALVLTSCGSPSEPGSATHLSEPTATPTVTVNPPTTGEPSKPTPEAEPTCDTIITTGTVDALTSEGWTVRQREFVIGDVTVEGGLECLWSDYNTASDHGQTYAWGPLTDAQARAAQASLLTDGWLRSTEGEVTYITEDPAYALTADDDGFGMTYEFGAGWVKFADTKQGLLLIEWGG